MHCSHCGKPFTAHHPARYCSEQCKHDMAHIRNTHNDRPDVCAVCGDPLPPGKRRRAARYCSTRCKKTAAQRRHRRTKTWPDTASPS